MTTLHLTLGHVPPHGGQAHLHGQGVHALGEGQKLPRTPDEGFLRGLGQRGHARSQPHAAKKAAAATAQGGAQGKGKARLGDALKA